MKEASAPTGHPAGRRPIPQAEAIARMEAYQNQLDRSLTEGRHRFDDLFDRPFKEECLLWDVIVQAFDDLTKAADCLCDRN